MNNNFKKLERFISYQFNRGNYYSMLMLLHSIFGDEINIGLIFEAHELQRLYINGIIGKKHTEITQFKERVMANIREIEMIEASFNIPNSDELVPESEITEQDWADCERLGIKSRLFTRARQYYLRLKRNCL